MGDMGLSACHRYEKRNQFTKVATSDLSFGMHKDIQFLHYYGEIWLVNDLKKHMANKLKRKERGCLMGYSLLHQIDCFSSCKFKIHTWISLQLPLDKIIWEGAKLLHPTYCNILSISLFPFLIKLIINLQQTNLQLASKRGKKGNLYIQ
jgi:hypothetical protein